MPYLNHANLSDERYETLLAEAQAATTPMVLGMLFTGPGGDTIHVNDDDAHYFVNPAQWQGLRAAGFEYAIARL